MEGPWWSCIDEEAHRSVLTGLLIRQNAVSACEMVRVLVCGAGNGKG